MGFKCDLSAQILSIGCFPYFLGRLINFAPIIAGVSAVFFIILAGIQFMLSGGDAVKVARARKTLTFAIIGLVIVVLSYFIIVVLGRILGLNCQNFGINC